MKQPWTMEYYTLLSMLVAEAMKEDDTSDVVDGNTYVDELERFNMQRNNKQYWTIFWQYALRRYRTVVEFFYKNCGDDWYKRALDYFSARLDVVKVKNTWYVEYLDTHETLQARTVTPDLKYNMFQDRRFDHIARLFKSKRFFNYYNTCDIY